jgi:hypothetical protein
MGAFHGGRAGYGGGTMSADLWKRHPGGDGWSPVGPNYLSADGAVIEDYCGRRHAYAATASAAEKNTVVSNP